MGDDGGNKTEKGEVGIVDRSEELWSVSEEHHSPGGSRRSKGLFFLSFSFFVLLNMHCFLVVSSCLTREECLAMKESRKKMRNAARQ